MDGFVDGFADGFVEGFVEGVVERASGQFVKNFDEYVSGRFGEGAVELVGRFVKGSVGGFIKRSMKGSAEGTASGFSDRFTERAVGGVTTPLAGSSFNSPRPTVGSDSFNSAGLPFGTPSLFPLDSPNCPGLPASNTGPSGYSSPRTIEMIWCLTKE